MKLCVYNILCRYSIFDILSYFVIIISLLFSSTLLSRVWTLKKAILSICLLAKSSPGRNFFRSFVTVVSLLFSASHLSNPSNYFHLSEHFGDVIFVSSHGANIPYVITYLLVYLLTSRPHCMTSIQSYIVATPKVALSL